MPALRELQKAFGAAILSGDMDAASAWVADGPIAAAERMRIHRNTMLATFAGALRLSFPAVDALVGTEFFDQAARDFAYKHPPKAALLTLYGAAFPEFLADYGRAASLPYLPDVARFEWAVELAARAPDWDEAAPRAELDLGPTRLAIAPSLALLRTTYPAERIWRAVLDEDEDAIAALDPGPDDATLAIWRQGGGAAVVPLGVVAAAFLDAITSGADTQTALTRAAAHADNGNPIAAISREVLQAGFARLIPNAREG